MVLVLIYPLHVDVAKVVFENCCKKVAPQDHPDHEITFNYEFLDDFDL